MARDAARKLPTLAVALALTSALVLTGCGGDDEASDAPAATQPTASETEFCAAVDALEESLLLMDADSVEEVDALFADVEAAYADVQEAAGDEYAEELQTFEEALTEFEVILESEDVQIRALVDATAELAVAGEVLAEEVDCAGA
jgi:hypothetical protein